VFPADHLEMPAVQKQSEDLKQNKQTKKNSTNIIVFIQKHRQF